jgi:hypothetical protein
MTFSAKLFYHDCIAELAAHRQKKAADTNLAVIKD